METDDYFWPPRVLIRIYGRGGNIVDKSRDRLFDISDSIMLNWPHHSRTVQLGFVTRSARWVAWNEEALTKIEELIRYDLGFDGYRATLKRLSMPGTPCAEEFRWSLLVRER